VLTDNGLGTRAEFLPVVFERFAQAEVGERRE
jgi:signal transduction histidine kinase